MTKVHDPITPRAILLTEFLEPLGVTQYRLAQATGLPQTRISEIVRGKRAITTETALRLSKALSVDDRFWINIHADYDLEIERDRHGDEIDKIAALVASWALAAHSCAPRNPNPVQATSLLGQESLESRESSEILRLGLPALHAPSCRATGQRGSGMRSGCRRLSTR